MKWLFIDTHERGKLTVGWIGAPGMFQMEGRSGGLMGFISNHISTNDLESASGICIVNGPGSFSSVRSGVLVANLFNALK